MAAHIRKVVLPLAQYMAALHTLGTTDLDSLSAHVAARTGVPDARVVDRGLEGASAVLYVSSDSFTDGSTCCHKDKAPAWDVAVLL